MLRLTRYLKPFVILILATIVLLFVQANADLALPDYMSKIVNVGIQQGGIENAVAEAIRQSQMEKLLIFMTEEEQTLILNNYTLVDQNSPEYEYYVEIYPSLTNEPIYVLNDVDQVARLEMNPIMGQAWVVVSGIERMLENPSTLPTNINLNIDPSNLPPGTDIFSLIEQLPAEQIGQVTSSFDQMAESIGESMINQMAVQAVGAEYEAIGMDTAKLQSSYIWRVGGMMLLISLLGGVCTIGVGFLAAKTAAGTARDIRLAIFQKVENFASAEFDKFSTASLITRSTNDVTQVQMVIFMMLRMIFYAPIIGIGGIIRAIEKSASMWWIIALAVAALISLILVVFAIAMPKFKIIQSLIDRLNLVTRENLSGMMVIRSFNKQDDEEKRFEVANRNLTDNSLFVARVMVTMMPVMMLLMNGLSLAIIWVGAHQVAEANIQVGDMMAFLQYAMQIVFAFLMMSMMFIFLPRAAVSGGRIADVLETELTIKDPQTPKSFKKPFRGFVEFQNVSFRYPDALDDVLHNISFTAQPGKTTAIIGSTGCGKSTVVNLIPRFFDVTEGSITLDGIDLRELNQSDLRDKIGYVPQKGILFSGTIESNLMYGNQNASHETIENAITISQAKEFIKSSPEGLKSEISQGGSNVSGGQKQRLAIARAIVKKPPIYIFDDSFSALDFKTDSALRKALKENTANSTVLLVTQRVATVKNADQIIVLDEGRVVGKGKHQELLKNCQTYREIATSQLSQEELV